MNLLKKILYILFLVILLPQFGQNKVQYDYFDWNFIQTKHFDIYYYGEGSNLIDFIAKQSEDAYDNHSSRMGWKLQNRIAIIIFNSHNDFQQNNVINTYMYEGISGVTELYKNRVVIPFDGSLKDFKHVLYPAYRYCITGRSKIWGPNSHWILIIHWNSPIPISIYSRYSTNKHSG